MLEKVPRVGIGVIVLNQGNILIGERLSGHGAGTWQIPGGHLEFGETFEEAAGREVFEETGIGDIEVIGVVSLGNDIAFDKHYVSVGILAHYRAGEIKNTEPEHSKNWGWHHVSELPAPLFPHSERVIKNWLEKTLYKNKNVI
jgi:8-oxo-dGTP diphosphatase